MSISIFSVFKFVRIIGLFIVVICKVVFFCCWWNWFIIEGNIFSVVVGSVLILTILLLRFFLRWSDRSVVLMALRILIVCVKNCSSGKVSCVFWRLRLNKRALVSCFSLFNVLESVGWFKLRVLVARFKVFCCAIVTNVWRWRKRMRWLNRLFFFISDVKNEAVSLISEVVWLW